MPDRFFAAATSGYPIGTRNAPHEHELAVVDRLTHAQIVTLFCHDDIAEPLELLTQEMARRLNTEGRVSPPVGHGTAADYDRDCRCAWCRAARTIADDRTRSRGWLTWAA
jgi:hypothetical protein